MPLKRPVAGISVGLVTEQNDQHEITSYKTLLDIIGSEDFYGDMDFKLCGTSEGVTGYQLDLKLPGIPSPYWRSHSRGESRPHGCSEGHE